jgi:hypothetical protein
MGDDLPDSVLDALKAGRENAVRQAIAFRRIGDSGHVLLWIQRAAEIEDAMTAPHTDEGDE